MPGVGPEEDGPMSSLPGSPQRQTPANPLHRPTSQANGDGKYVRDEPARVPVGTGRWPDSPKSTQHTRKTGSKGGSQKSAQAQGHGDCPAPAVWEPRRQDDAEVGSSEPPPAQWACRLSHALQARAELGDTGQVKPTGICWNVFGTCSHVH